MRVLCVVSWLVCVCGATKLGDLSRTLLSNALVGRSVARVSDTYQVCATPSDETFGIWGPIYIGLLRASFEPPYEDAVFARSMELTEKWLEEWMCEDLRAANTTIQTLRHVNGILVDNCVATRCASIDAYDTYDTWVQIASLLNDQIVRVWLDHKDDHSLRAAQQLVDSFETSRPGVKYAVDRASTGRQGCPDPPIQTPIRPTGKAISTCLANKGLHRRIINLLFRTDPHP